ncbi:MAG TPA: YbdK family carboxylate-amine ligase [Nitrospirae bacterium]|nr:YbdK family carboxylate-amine ligase [Nitrospirota bacterium]
MLEFNSSPEPTVGVEIELQLIDRTSFDLKNIAPLLLKSISPSFKGRIKEEFIQSMIELNTGICSTVMEVERDLRESLKYLEERLAPLDAAFYSSSLHPFARVKHQRITLNPRYSRIMDDLQIVGRRFISQGLHVHIGIDDPEKAIRVNNTIRIYLPLLLALTTSSPFYEGEYTGLYSYRTKLYDALPRAGMPDSFENWDEYKRVVALLKKGGYIESVKDLWWDVRPHPDFGTVEVRVCDLPYRLKDILAITALIQALVVSIARRDIQPGANIQILRANKWQASRYGLEGVFVDPARATRYTMRDAAGALLDIVETEAKHLGSGEYLSSVEEILREGTGAHRQIAYYRKRKDFRLMISDLKEEFYK